MSIYQSKALPFSGTAWSEIAPQTRRFLRTIARRTKRRPYIRSAYFKKDKIFLTYLWTHLAQIPQYQRARRMKYLPCAIELVQKSRQIPEVYLKRDRPKDVFYRFSGKATNGTEFAVQIKENLRSRRKELMSVFPYK